MLAMAMLALRRSAFNVAALAGPDGPKRATAGPDSKLALNPRFAAMAAFRC